MIINFFSDHNPEVVKSIINGNLAVASCWFDDDKLVLNPEIELIAKINVRALRCVYIKQVPLYGNDAYGLTLSNRRLQNIAILIFKAANGMLREYISELFVLQGNVKNLRGTNKLILLGKNTTDFDLKFTSFIGAKV